MFLEPPGKGSRWVANDAEGLTLVYLSVQRRRLLLCWSRCCRSGPENLSHYSLQEVEADPFHWCEVMSDEKCQARFFPSPSFEGEEANTATMTQSQSRDFQSAEENGN